MINTYARDASIQEVFASVAARFPHSTAVIEGATSLSYGEMEKRSNQLSRRLKTLGLRAGDVVFMLCGRGAETLIAMLAVLKAGAAFAPADLSYPPEQISSMLGDCSPKLVLMSDPSGVAGQLPVEGVPTFVLSDVLNEASAESAEPIPNINSATDLAYIMFTSGSTGRPKGVACRHRGVVRLVKEQTYASFSPNEVFLHMAPLPFDASTFEIWGALLNGGAVVVLPQARPSLAEIGTTIRDCGVTTAWLTAGLFHLMVDHRIEDLKPLRQLLAGGDVLSPSHVQKALRELPDTQLINGYGPTENTTFTCCYPIPKGGWSDGAVPLGKSIAHSAVYILDDNLNLVPDGESGQICAGGDGVAAGYVGRPDLTSAKFVTDPFSDSAEAAMYLTGDIGRRRSDGVIEFIGRRDRQVKLNGNRIELDGIESELRRSPGVADAVVLLREDGADRKHIAAYLRLESGAEGDDAAAEIAAALSAAKASLPQHMAPSEVFALKEFPLNPQGKVDRKQLHCMAPARFATSSEPGSSVETNDLEVAIASAWSKVLKREMLPGNVNFFDLGGTSLDLVRVHELLARLGLDITVLDLFQYPTVNLLTAYLKDRKSITGMRMPQNRGALQAEAMKRFRTRR